MGVGSEGRDCYGLEEVYVLEWGECEVDQGRLWREPDAAGDTHAFLWEDGVMQDLGTLGGAFTFSVAGSINNRGQVVGANFMSSGQSRAFVWQDGVMTALDDSDGSSSALGINARGDIAGQILPAGAVLWVR